MLFLQEIDFSSILNKHFIVVFIMKTFTSILLTYSYTTTENAFTCLPKRFTLETLLCRSSVINTKYISPWRTSANYDVHCFHHKPTLTSTLYILTPNTKFIAYITYIDIKLSSNVLSLIGTFDYHYFYPIINGETNIVGYLSFVEKPSDQELSNKIWR